MRRKLAELGYDVTGVDMSEGMLEAAEVRRLHCLLNWRHDLKFEHGDARSFRLGRKFDAVISLFHVMSYQTTNADLAAAFASVREHLAPGGTFIFDCWYGRRSSASGLPLPKKNFRDEATHVEACRRARDSCDAKRCRRELHRDVTDRATSRTEVLKETHNMRYLFSPEVEVALERRKCELVESRGWLTDSEPDFGTWGACFTAKG